MPRGNPLIDLTGQQLGNWTVLRRGSRWSQARWWCRCVCGAEVEVLAQTLRAGKSLQCVRCGVKQAQTTREAKG